MIRQIWNVAPSLPPNSLWSPFAPIIICLRVTGLNAAGKHDNYPNMKQKFPLTFEKHIRKWSHHLAPQYILSSVTNVICMQPGRYTHIHTHVYTYAFTEIPGCSPLSCSNVRRSNPVGPISHQSISYSLTQDFSSIRVLGSLFYKKRKKENFFCDLLNYRLKLSLGVGCGEQVSKSLWMSWLLPRGDLGKNK